MREAVAKCVRLARQVCKQPDNIANYAKSTQSSRMSVFRINRQAFRAFDLPVRAIMKMLVTVKFEKRHKNKWIFCQKNFLTVTELHP